MRVLISLAALIFVVPVWAQTCPKLSDFYEKLSGQWLGTGRSVNMVTNSSWGILVRTQSKQEKSYLKVTNIWSEFRESGEINYTLSYLLQGAGEPCADGTLKVYMIQSLNDRKENKVAGYFDGESLVLNQDLPEGYSLLSQTIFSSDSTSTNRMLLIRNGLIIQRTELIYRVQQKKK